MEKALESRQLDDEPVKGAVFSEGQEQKQGRTENKKVFGIHPRCDEYQDRKK